MNLIVLLEELGEACVVETGEVSQLLQLHIDLVELLPRHLLLRLRQKGDARLELKETKKKKKKK